MVDLTLKEALQRLVFQEDTKVLSYLRDLRGRVRKDSWLKVAGEAWSRCEGTSFHAHWLFHESPIADRRGPIREMMTKEEFQFLMSLESPITIYRGCYRDLNDYGNCYSLDRSIASQFPFLDRYKPRNADANPILLIATVDHDDIIAYKNCREEQEIIIRTCQNIDEIELEDPPLTNPI